MKRIELSFLLRAVRPKAHTGRSTVRRRNEGRRGEETQIRDRDSTLSLPVDIAPSLNWFGLNAWMRGVLDFLANLMARLLKSEPDIDSGA